jgi:serine/threonine-protein kinase RIO1
MKLAVCTPSAHLTPSPPHFPPSPTFPPTPLQKRDYLVHRRSASWLYMSKLGAMKEFAFMRALHDAGFPVPTPLAHNRHAIVMSLAPGKTLMSVRTLADPPAVFAACLDVALRLADAGLVHCDLNEFNIIVDPDAIALLTPSAGAVAAAEAAAAGAANVAAAAHTPSSSSAAAAAAVSTEATAAAAGAVSTQPVIPLPAPVPVVPAPLPRDCLTVIDFPQMVSTSHPNAAELFERDVGCLVTFFKRRFNYVPSSVPSFAALAAKTRSLDVVVEASGFSRAQAEELAGLLAEQERAAGGAGAEEDGEEEDGEEEDSEGDEDGAEAPAGEAGAGAVDSAPAAAAAAGDAYFTVSSDVLNAKEEEAEEAGAGAGNDGGEDGEGDGEEEEGEDGGSDASSVDSATRRRRAAELRAAEAALAGQRVPDGVRTRPGGRRIKPRGGEAYLRKRDEIGADAAQAEADRLGAGGEGEEGGEGAGVGRGGAEDVDVRAKVRIGLQRGRAK